MKPCPVCGLPIRDFRNAKHRDCQKATPFSTLGLELDDLKRAAKLGGNRWRTAQLLGINEAHFNRTIKKYGLEIF